MCAVLPTLHHATVRSGPGTPRSAALPSPGRTGRGEGDCPRCGRTGFIRTDTGWCGPCSRPARGGAAPGLRVCGEAPPAFRAGNVFPVLPAGSRPATVRGEHLIAELADPPEWLQEFVVFLATRHCPGRATTMISVLGRLLTDEQPNDPQAVLERARRSGRSMGSLARGLQGFFTQRHLAMPTDHHERWPRPASTPRGRRPAGVAASSPSIRRAADSRTGNEHEPQRPGHGRTRPSKPRWARFETWQCSWPLSAINRTGRWWTCMTSRRSWLQARDQEASHHCRAAVLPLRPHPADRPG